MRVSVKYGSRISDFKDQTTITIGNSDSCDVKVDKYTGEKPIKLIFSKKYNNYVLVNSENSSDVLFNDGPFSKVLVPQMFSVKMKNSSEPIVISIENNPILNNKNDIFDNEIEENRIAIIKEMGNDVQDLKNTVGSMNITSFILNAAIVVLSVTCSFGITNFLLGLRADNTTSVLKLTTNFGFLICISTVVLSVALLLKHGIYSIMEFNATSKYGDSDMIQKIIVSAGALFMFIFYTMNLFYYKDVPGLAPAAFFIAVLFVGTLMVASIASGYFKYQLKYYNNKLVTSEYRADFETILKNYSRLIYAYINSLSRNRIENIKSALINNQIRMIIEVIVGIITAPFLAYGVSNTLAGCFPEAASWIRISGIRFSPIFLVLATFLIIFAFFSFVRAFTISKQLRSSEIIKFDGFHDYNSHGVTILGLDAMRTLNKEKNTVMLIACFIIMIEFTMNVSYFITEIGGDIQGMFLSFVTAIVPTALLVAETMLLSTTMHKINNYNELLAMLD